MRALRPILAITLFLSIFSHTAVGATLGTVINVTGGAADIVLDQQRDLLYLVRSVPYNRIDVFSTTQRRIIVSIPTDANPLAAALNADGSFLYVNCHDAASVNVIDTRSNPPRLVNKVSLPARPEGIAVGADERVLITTIGSGANNLLNTLLIYDPNATDSGRSVLTVPVAPPPPLPPQLPPLAGRTFLANRSQLLATPDRTRIIGLNAFQATNRVVFVYESASGSVLRSRIVGDTSTVLSVSPDGSRFMVGLRLFETESLTVLAQQNAANAPFPISTNITAQGFALAGQQFNLQQNQGGSIFAPNGSALYAAFNLAPVANPPARPNITQLMINDPDNLFINDALQLPENLAGKMVISPDGGTIYALSESGFTIVPLNEAVRNPIIQPSSYNVLLANDQCNSTAEGRSIRLDIVNSGRAQGPIVVTPTLLQSLGGAPVPGLGGIGGPGGGAPGGGIIIIGPGPIPGLPIPALPGGGQVPGGLNTQQIGILQTAPTVRPSREGNNVVYDLVFNNTNTRSLGTGPSHDFLLTSPQAVNVPSSFRVYQNSRNTDSRGEIVPIRTGISPNEGLVDIVSDPVRGRLYIANSGLNRVEVYDTRARRLLSPIKVGQLPRSLAISPDSSVLYVASSGSEAIHVIDLEKLELAGRIKMPAIPFNGNVPVIAPSVIAATQNGLQVVMSNGTLWRVIGDELVPRRLSAVIGANTVPAPRTMAATPNGEFMLLLAGNGNAYLYDAAVDDFVAARQVAPAPITGYFGPVSAGPRGQYFVVNGLVLNQSLSPIAGVGNTPGGGGLPIRPGVPNVPTTRPISAVFAASGSQFSRYTQPIRANANAPVTDSPTVELVDINTGLTVRQVPVLEGPLSTVMGNARANIDGRTMAVDGSLTTAYVLSTSGLSVVPLDPPSPAGRPAVATNGIVNVGSFTTSAAPNALVSIFGQNLGSEQVASTTPLPSVLGGTCVTVNNTPIPLLMASSGQINAQIPTELAAGRHTMIIRSIDRKISSQPVQLTVTKYAPAVLTEPESNRALIFRANGEPITPQRPAKRDEPIVMYAVGLGNPKGTTRIASGAPAPTDRTFETDAVKVYFKKVESDADKTRGFRAQEEVIVDWSGLVPGYVGLYQLNMRVPGFHEKGQRLEVVVTIGGVNSSITGPVVPWVSVE